MRPSTSPPCGMREKVTHTETQDAIPISHDNKIDISTLGLQRSQRIKDHKKTEFEIPTPSKERSFLLHIEYLDINFNGTQNSLSIIVQIFGAEVSNKNYTSKEMMKQLDRKEFEAAMYKEVKHMFDSEV
eukprot:3659289-Ditylum_brightwellii.AAC.1